MAGASPWGGRYDEDPERFGIDREGEPPHLDFGGGSVACIGRYAVTMEVEVVAALVATRYPRLDHAAFSRSPMFTFVSECRATLAA
jgi:cytochrome P450